MAVLEDLLVGEPQVAVPCSPLLSDLLVYRRAAGLGAGFLLPSWGSVGPGGPWSDTFRIVVVSRYILVYTQLLPLHLF